MLPAAPAGALAIVPPMFAAGRLAAVPIIVAAAVAATPALAAIGTRRALELGRRSEVLEDSLTARIARAQSK